MTIRHFSIFLTFFSCCVLPLRAQFNSPAGGPGTLQQSPPERSPPVSSIGASPRFNQNPLSGSIRSGDAMPGMMDLSLEEAINRGVRYNLAIVEGGEAVRLRRAERLQALSRLLPVLSIRPSISEQQVNLAAFGFTGFPGVPPVVGPFTVYDARAYGSESLSFGNWRRYRASKLDIQSAELTNKDTRDQVVLVVAAAYLQALAGAARIDSQRAQLETANVQYQQALDRKNAGTVAGIDVLRAQVQTQTQQQRLIAYEGDLEKEKIMLARVIGLPLAQNFQLIDKFDPQPLPGDLTFESVLKQAYEQRPDVQAAEIAVKSAELSKSAAHAGRLPSAGVDANYGANGLRPGTLHGSFTVAGYVNIPIYQAGRVRAEVEEADAVLRQRKASLDDLRGQIDADIRTAFTDLRSASRQVEVATRNLDLARQELQQAQDRFGAGVTNNLEVVRAQDSVAAANESYIASLFYYNTAKASLLRARGDLETTIRILLRSGK